jgi:cytidylate kinase
MSGEPHRGLVVAIDGPAGVGKSTLARRMAMELGLPYVNTGLMYRALTAFALREGIDLENGLALRNAAGEIEFDLDLTARPPLLRIDGRAPGDDLVAPEVEANVSEVSSHPAVRELMREEQRRLGRDGAVMEGRDIGSVVFPDADVKIRLEAHPRERVVRRSRERAEGLDVEESLTARDDLDSKVNPFVAAPGAATIDTTDKDADTVFAEAMAVVREGAGPR